MSDDLARIIPADPDADTGLSVSETQYAQQYADHLSVGDAGTGRTYSGVCSKGSGGGECRG